MTTECAQRPGVRQPSGALAGDGIKRQGAKTPRRAAENGHRDIARRRAGFPACRFAGLSSPVFRTGDWKVARTGRQECLPYILAGRQGGRLQNPGQRRFGVDDFGLRRQSGSGDGAFGRTRNIRDAKDFRACESGVAQRLPPQSKTRWRAGRADVGDDVRSLKYSAPSF
jgi:hypothetical protein